MKYLADRTALWASCLIFVAAIALTGIFIKDLSDERKEMNERMPKWKPNMDEDNRKEYEKQMRNYNRQIRNVDTYIGLFVCMLLVNGVAALIGISSTTGSSNAAMKSFVNHPALGLISSILAFGVFWVFLNEKQTLPRTAAFFNLVTGLLLAYSSTVMSVKNNHGNTTQGNAPNIHTLNGNGQTVYTPPGYVVSQGVPVTA